MLARKRDFVRLASSAASFAARSPSISSAFWNCSRKVPSMLRLKKAPPRRISTT